MLLRAQRDDLIEQLTRLRHRLPFRPQQVQVHLLDMAARFGRARGARQECRDVFLTDTKVERGGQARPGVLRKILAQAQLRIGQQAGGERLRAGQPEFVPLELQRRAVRHGQHCHLGCVQAVGRIEAVCATKRAAAWPMSAP